MYGCMYVCMSSLTLPYLLAVTDLPISPAQNAARSLKLMIEPTVCMYVCMYVCMWMLITLNTYKMMIVFSGYFNLFRGFTVFRMDCIVVWSSMPRTYIANIRAYRLVRPRCC